VPAYQPGIFDKSRAQHEFLEYSLRQGDNRPAVLAALRTLVTASLPGDVIPVLAFGHRLWSQLDARFDVPAFSLEGRVPATQGDLLVWLQGSSRSDLFDASMQVDHLLRDYFSLQLEVQSFVYHDMRDLSGFVDGIGNPAGQAARDAALVGAGHPGEGGSFVLTQKWVHDLDAFNHHSVEEQEKIFGRTKADAVEFDEAHMPADAHVGRTDISRDGVPQKIWRRSVPYGSVSEHGLYFVAFSCELDRLDYLLRNMYGMNEDGIRDRMLEFTQPLTSSWWYAPTQDYLSTL